MDFIEQLFGVAPDGGSGLVEVLLLLALMVIQLLIARGWRSAAIAERESAARLAAAARRAEAR